VCASKNKDHLAKRGNCRIAIGRIRPKAGDLVRTSHGDGIVLNVFDYDDIVQEMRAGGCGKEAIERLKARIVFFLGKTNSYFECEIRFSNGILRSDWSDCRVLAPNRDDDLK